MNDEDGRKLSREVHKKILSEYRAKLKECGDGTYHIVTTAYLTAFWTVLDKVLNMLVEHGMLPLNDAIAAANKSHALLVKGLKEDHERTDDATDAPVQQ